MLKLQFETLIDMNSLGDFSEEVGYTNVCGLVFEVLCAYNPMFESLPQYRATKYGTCGKTGK
jgi:hypothetical protein